MTLHPWDLFFASAYSVSHQEGLMSREAVAAVKADEMMRERQKRNLGTMYPDPEYHRQGLDPIHRRLVEQVERLMPAKIEPIEWPATGSGVPPSPPTCSKVSPS